MSSTANLCHTIQDEFIPGLNTILEPSLLNELMRQSQPSVAGTIWRIDYLRYKPGRRCLALLSNELSSSLPCVVTAYDRQDFAKSVAKLIHRYPDSRNWWKNDSSQVIATRFPIDLGLRPLAKLEDDHSEHQLVRRILGPDAAVHRGALRMLAYKPGRRYVGASISNDDQLSFSLRIYTKQQYPRILPILHQSTRLAVPTPRVLATSERYQAAALSWIPGISLDRIIQVGDAIDASLCSTAQLLYRLHNDCSGPKVTVTTSINWAMSVQKAAEDVAFLIPSLAKRTRELARHIAQELESNETEQTLIHNDFYAKQVIINDSAASFIDFDGLAVGERYRDLGNFVAKLFWMNVRGEITRESAQAYANTFLAAYVQEAGHINIYRYRVYLSAAILLCATHPFRRLCCNWTRATQEIVDLASWSVPNAGTTSLQKAWDL
ncbi:MAG: aminoglycoside phosphotransferase family protein [Planctomycetales bacterium]|nr:aminoglycoside phosphotransferase family protein [Planctomycetales bacterium]